MSEVRLKDSCEVELRRCLNVVADLNEPDLPPSLRVGAQGTQSHLHRRRQTKLQDPPKTQPVQKLADILEQAIFDIWKENTIQ